MFQFQSIFDEFEYATQVRDVFVKSKVFLNTTAQSCNPFLIPYLIP